MELHETLCRGEQRVIATLADVESGVQFGAALADQDHAGFNGLSAVRLNPKALRCRLASVAGGSGALLMCHRATPVRSVRTWWWIRPLLMDRWSLPYRPCRPLSIARR